MLSVVCARQPPQDLLGREAECFLLFARLLGMAMCGLRQPLLERVDTAAA